MIRVFDTLEKFEAYTANGMVSGDLYYVKQNGSVHFRTNNINGIDTSYNIGGESGNTTENGESGNTTESGGTGEEVDIQIGL